MKMSKKPQNKFHVLRSGQEKKNFWHFDPDDYCSGTTQCPIETGDYMIKELPDKIFTIERKFSVGEIYNNMFEKRFSNELERLQEFKYRFIICQFDARDVISFPFNSGIPKMYWDGLKANGNYIMSKLTHYTIKMKVPVIFAGPGKSSQDLAMFYMRQVARLEGLI